MPFRKPYSLRALVLLGSGLLSLCGIAAIATLFLTTKSLNRASATISEAVNSIVAAEELQKTLLEYSRERTMLALGDEGDDQVSDASVDETEAKIRYWYERIEMHAGSMDESRIVTEVQALIESYIASRPRDEKIGSLGQAFLLGRQYLDPARVKIRDLVLLNQQEAEEAQQAIHVQDQLAEGLGIAISIALVTLIFFLLYGVRIHFYKPLMALRRTMQAFGGGDMDARAAAIGPLELGEISREFNELADGLQRAKAQHFRFLAAVAHDLRNPLSALRMSFELVSTARPDEVTEKRQIEDIAKRQIDQLDQMVGDLLDSSRIESGKFELAKETRDLRLDVEQAVALHKQVSPAHRLTLTLPNGPLRCEYDSLRMSQVLNNLVSNAIKYSPNGGTIGVRLLHESHEAIIEVSDQGMGISPEDLKGIFEPFRRSRITRDTIPGVGLGLAVAKRLVEAHGGKLTVTSFEGRGSIFRVHLPLERAEKHTPGSIVAYLSSAANGLVSRGGRSHAGEVPIEQG